MRCNRLRSAVGIVAACTVLAACATQGSQVPPVSYGYRAAPDFSSTNAAPGMRGMPGVAREMHQDKERVQFPSAFATGEIIVSFADRRLYYVEARGRALSYPIAIPRDEDRWKELLSSQTRKSIRRGPPPQTCCGRTPGFRRSSLAAIQ